MNSNENLISKFYTAFANGNIKMMLECYHPQIHFEDPVFGPLKNEQVFTMWEMLLLKSKGNIKIEFKNVTADEFLGSTDWIATYNFSKTNREVINKINANFEFKDDLIIRHTDQFSIWNWSKQAFGLSGYFLGWTRFFKNKIRKEALKTLQNYSLKI